MKPVLKRQKIQLVVAVVGKLYDSINHYICSVQTEDFQEYSSDNKLWHYTEFGSKLKSWNSVGFLRTIFTTQLCDDTGQMLLDIARPDSVLYTNIGCNMVSVI